MCVHMCMREGGRGRERGREREREESLLQPVCDTLLPYTIYLGQRLALSPGPQGFHTEKLEIESSGLTLQTLKNILIIILVTSREAEL